MASDTTLRPGELKDILLREIASADLASTDVSEVGTVLEVRDGIARIYGLNSAIASEMLEFTAQETGETVAGLVLNLEEDNVGAAIMGDYLKLKEGDEVRRTGRLLEVPVGPGMLGRVVNALGQPVDGLGPIKASGSRQVEMVAPGIIVRQPVCRRRRRSAGAAPPRPAGRRRRRAAPRAARPSTPPPAPASRSRTGSPA
jgi:F-type H+-transporting ATPase subunit alpha